MLYGSAPRSAVHFLPQVQPLPPLELPDQTVQLILKKLGGAKQPLVIVGKGVAYSRAEEAMRSFVKKSNLPFLATPMGKGVVSDYDKNSANSARTFVLQNADVILLCGARLNWILHFGMPPRFRADVQIIQIDSDPLEMHTNVKAALPITGDLLTVIGQLDRGLKHD